MTILGFFRNLFNNFATIYNFVTTPLGQLYDFDLEPFSSTSIIGLLGIGIGGTLVVLIIIHIVKLFI